MRPLLPVDTAPLLRPLLRELLAVLEGLETADWARPTVAPAWRVRDVAAHLLDNDLRKIAVYRDGHSLAPERPIVSDQDLADLVNGLNASGVAWAARLSPRLVTDLLRITGEWVADLLSSIPRDAPSIFPVSWAGEHVSAQWMDTGREYTERWHHQMQIRDAIGVRRLLEPDWMVPLIEFSLRALPRAFASLDAAPGTTVTLEVHGETAGTWSLQHGGEGWQVMRGRPERPDALVRAPADVAWRIFYNALAGTDARTRVDASGPPRLLDPLLQARSVIL